MLVTRENKKHRSRTRHAERMKSTASEGRLREFAKAHLTFFQTWFFFSVAMQAIRKRLLVIFWLFPKTDNAFVPTICVRAISARDNDETPGCFYNSLFLLWHFSGFCSWWGLCFCTFHSNIDNRPFRICWLNCHRTVRLRNKFQVLQEKSQSTASNTVTFLCMYDTAVTAACSL